MGPLSLRLDHETRTASCLTLRSGLHSTHRSCLESICVLVSLVTKVGQSHMSPTNAPPHGLPLPNQCSSRCHPSPLTSEPADWASSNASSSLAQDPLPQTSGVDCTFGASVLRITPGELLLSLLIRSVEPVTCPSLLSLPRLQTRRQRGPGPPRRDVSCTTRFYSISGVFWEVPRSRGRTRFMV